MLKKTVVVIGCGSIGGTVAHLLAQAGVGRICLVDPDNLSWDNVARHILGGNQYLGSNKAEGMRRFLTQCFPHLEVKAVPDDWKRVFDQDSAIFAGADAVVSTTADWSSEAALNMISRRSLNLGPVVFGWTEEHAIAGHALAVLDIGGCLSCGCDHLGHFKNSVVMWEKDQLVRTPACGAFYQPYGSIDLAPIQAMIADVVMEVLLSKVNRSHHRVWMGNMGRLSDLGGSVSEIWQNHTGDSGLGQRVHRCDWHVDGSCEICR